MLGFAVPYLRFQSSEFGLFLAIWDGGSYHSPRVTGPAAPRHDELKKR